MFKFPFSLNFLYNTSLSINSDFSIWKSLAKWEKETFSGTFEKNVQNYSRYSVSIGRGSILTTRDGSYTYIATAFMVLKTAQ